MIGKAIGLASKDCRTLVLFSSPAPIEQIDLNREEGIVRSC